MPTYALSAQKREPGKKSAVKDLRKKGKVPAVVYGKENLHIAVDNMAFERVFQDAGAHALISLDVEGKKYETLIKEYALDPVSRAFAHVDFLEVQKGKKLRTHIPFKFIGTPAGVKEGGVLEHAMYELYVQCEPNVIPEHLELDITNLQVGHSLHVSDVVLPENVELVDEPEKVVCQVISAAKMAAAGEPEETAPAESTDAPAAN